MFGPPAFCKSLVGRPHPPARERTATNASTATPTTRTGRRAFGRIGVERAMGGLYPPALRPCPFLRATSSASARSSTPSIGRRREPLPSPRRPRTPRCPRLLAQRPPRYPRRGRPRGLPLHHRELPRPGPEKRIASLVLRGAADGRPVSRPAGEPGGRGQRDLVRAPIVGDRRRDRGRPSPAVDEAEP